MSCIDRIARLKSLQLYGMAACLCYQLKAAKFPIHRDLAGFDWGETPLQ